MCSVDAEYYRGIESVLNGLEMAFSGIVVMLYMIDILDYTVIDDSWGIGIRSCEYCDSNCLCPGCYRQLPIRVEKPVPLTIFGRIKLTISGRC